MKIIWYGTASILLKSNGDSILFDPFVSLKGGENKTDINKYLNEKNIFITHGHFDHLGDAKEIIENGKATIYCTNIPFGILKRKKVNPDRVVVISPDDTFNFGEIKIKVIKSKHNKVDMLLILKHILNFPRSFKYMRNLIFILARKRHFAEGKETSAFIVEAEDKKMLVLGSMALDKSENKFDNIDILVLPFQGRSNNAICAKEIIKDVKPKTVILSHFDNTFPPLTEEIDTEPFISAMKHEFPEMTVIKPEFQRAIEF